MFRLSSHASRAVIAASLLAVAAAAQAGDDKEKAAAAAPAKTAPAAAEEIAIGAKAPDFTLKGTDGKQHALSAILAPGEGMTAPKATVVVFTCNACPYAKAYEPVLIELAKKYADQPVAWALINPNDPTIVPDDSFEKMQVRAKEKSYPFPYLFDETQQTARAYGAARTPHVFLVDSKGMVRYHGRISDNQDPAVAKSFDLVNAVDALLADKEVATTSTKAFGCGIKWKKSS